MSCPFANVGFVRLFTETSDSFLVLSQETNTFVSSHDFVSYQISIQLHFFVSPKHQSRKSFASVSSSEKDNKKNFQQSTLSSDQEHLEC